MCNTPHCCLPQESGPCLSPSVAAHPLRPATRHRLGRPSPHQQADRPRAHPPPKHPKMKLSRPGPCGPAGTPRISRPFKQLSRSRGQVTHVILTRSPLNPPPKKKTGPFDLHVLSTPPAFVLSQDQTLQKNQSPRQHHEPRKHKPPRNQHHPDKQNNQAHPRHTQQDAPRTHPAKNQTNKQHKNKTHYRDLKQHTQHPDYRRNESSGVAVRRSKNLAGEFATVKPGTCDPSLSGHLIRTVEFLGPHRPHGSWRQMST